MDEILLKLLVALAVNELIHNAFEIWGVRQKVSWLSARMGGRPHGKWPININTDFKAYGLHAALFFIITCLVFFVLLLVDVSNQSLLLSGVIFLIISYAWTTTAVHEYHLEIGKLLRKFKSR